MQKLIACLSCDLDNMWAYLQTHGDSRWKSLPSYLDILVPRLLQFLKVRSLPITVFVVGQDAVVDRNREIMMALSEAGHEIGNHTFRHEPWLHLYSDADIEREVAQAEEGIERATGQKPVGFRGPGYSLSFSTLRVLAKRRYLYDATTLPNVLNPLARAYFLMTAELSQADLRRRETLFGSFKDGFRPVKPYQWRLDDLTLIEIPVTTMPILRMPFHVSYILYLSGFSRSLALLYFRTALRICRLTGTEPSLLLHSLDFMSCEDIRDLSFFPGMTLPLEEKLELLGEIVDLFCQTFTVLTMREYARAQAARAVLRLVEVSVE